MQIKITEAFKKWLRWGQIESQPKILRDLLRQELKVFVIKRLWRTDVKIRYAPIIKYIRNKSLKNQSILEIGSGPLGLTKFINKKIVGLDISFEGPHLGYLVMIKGNCHALPFKTSSFDYTICMDMLEHINHSSYDDALSEIFRVTRKTIIVGFPTGKEAKNIEQRVRIFVEEKMKKWKGKEETKMRFFERNQFLFQHVEMGLPSTEEIINILHGIIKRTNRAAQIQIVKNQGVKFWSYFVRAGLEYNLPWMISVILLNLAPVSLFNIGWGGFYRTILFIEK